MKKRIIIAVPALLVFAAVAVCGIKINLFKELYGLIWVESISRNLSRFQCERPTRKHLESTVFRRLRAVDIGTKHINCMAFSDFAAEYRFEHKNIKFRSIVYFWGKESFFAVLYDDSGKMVDYANCYE